MKCDTCNFFQDLSNMAIVRYLYENFKQNTRVRFSGAIQHLLPDEKSVQENQQDILKLMIEIGKDQLPNMIYFSWLRRCKNHELTILFRTIVGHTEIYEPGAHYCSKCGSSHLNCSVETKKIQDWDSSYDFTVDYLETTNYWKCQFCALVVKNSSRKLLLK